jgi:hypothetical protein
VETPPKAQIAYENLASQMRPPRPPAEARNALYKAVNRKLDKLEGARLDGRPMMTITPWQRAYDDLVEQIGGLTAVVESMHARRATLTAVECDALLADGRNRRDAINRILGAFTQPDEAVEYFQRGGRLATDNPVGDSAVLTRDLVTVRKIDQLMAQITREPDPERKQTRVAELEAEVRRLAPGTRGPDAKGLGFAAHFHMPTVVEVVEAIHQELAACPLFTDREINRPTPPPSPALNQRCIGFPAFLHSEASATVDRDGSSP